MIRSGLVVCLALSGLLGCVASRKPGEGSLQVTGLGSLTAEQLASSDAILFELVVRDELTDAVHRNLRVDTRPLRNDPGLVTLHAMTMVPDVVAPESWSNPLAPQMDRQTRARSAVLERLKVQEVDGLAKRDCPGVLVPDSPQELRAERCPRETYLALLIALPRTGGSYWPANFDERFKYGGTVASVRVIRRYLSPQGSVESSADYVFAREGSGWKLLEIKRILIVE